MNSSTYVNERGELVVECTHRLPDGVDPEAAVRFVSARLTQALRAEIEQFADEFLLDPGGGGSKVEPN
jgi:hypothetical protein